MNQMTPENYNKKAKILIEFVTTNAHNDDNLKKIIKVIYEKAKLEFKYGEMYAKLVKSLIKEEMDIKKLP